MTRLTNGIICGAALMALAATMPAHAQTFFPDRASFLAATHSDTTIGFEGLAPDGGFTVIAAPPGITLSGANFTIDRGGSDGNLFVIGKDFYYPGNSVLSSQESSTGTDNLLITLPFPTTAIAMDLGAFSSSTVTFNLSNGDTFTAPVDALPTLDFVGFTTATPVTSLLLTQPTSATVLNIDNFTFGLVGVAPEPGSLALLGMAALPLAGVIRRRKA